MRLFLYLSECLILQNFYVFVFRNKKMRWEGEIISILFNND